MNSRWGRAPIFKMISYSMNKSLFKIKKINYILPIFRAFSLETSKIGEAHIKLLIHTNPIIL